MEKKYKEPIESEMETTVNVLYGENCLSLYTNKPEIQRKLNQQINELNSKPKVIEKTQSLNNRNEFIGGKNYVQLTKDAPVVLTKSFVTLNKAAMANINSYIKRNILKFKTRMRKNINTLNKANIDMKKTIQNACKTGGLPLNICFEEPKANKTK